MHDVTTSPPVADAMQAWLDRAAIAHVIQEWALARDTGRWERLRASYTADATMHTTWFAGSADEFVRRSIEMAKKAGRVQHFIGATNVALAGDRAIAETRMVLLLRAPLDGVEVDVTCHGRFYDFFVRQGGDWRISKRMVIYEKDRIDPVDPAAVVKLDAADLARFPEGYRHVAYVQARGGANVMHGMPTPNSDSLKRLYAEGAAWLADPRDRTDTKRKKGRR